MKKIALMMMLVFLCTATVAHAIPMWIEGYVNNGEGRPIVGAKLDWNFPEGITTVYTNSLGKFGFLDHSYCGPKFVYVSAYGYLLIRRGVSDDTCCECVETCDPNDPNTICSSLLQVNFTLYGPDADRDGYYNVEDNCPYASNGPDRGTCTIGTNVGDLCQSHTECQGCLKYCSMAQEDGDHDGIGDACEGASAQVYTASSVSVAGINEYLQLYALLMPLYCARQGGCDYACLGQAVEDFMNGPEFSLFFGRPIWPEDRPLVYECEDFLNLQELVNLFLDNWFDIIYGGNFPK